MRCIYCKNDDTSVIDSRHFENNNIKRRRECKKCGKRFNTYEGIELQPITVIKKNGTSMPFNKQKIYNSIVRALIKRKYDIEKIDELVVDIENEIRENYTRGIESREIGDIILKHLLHFDEVAYVRFASVYNKFENLDRFIEIINEIKKDKRKIKVEKK